MLSRAFACLAVLVAVVLGASASPAFAQAQPPSFDIPDTALHGQLPSRYEKVIADRVQYWADMLRNATDEKQVIQARNGLVSDFGQYKSADVQFIYAKESAARLTPILSLPGQHRMVNAAMALSQMEQGTVQPALEAMVVHSGSAVRYFGWQGYRRVRIALLSGASEYRQTMFDSLAKAAAEEQDMHVLKRVLQMLYLPPVRPETVTEAVYADARDRCTEILAGTWASRCPKIAAGEAEMVDSAQVAVVTAMGLAGTAPENSPQRSKLYQVMVDTMYATAKAYDAAGGTGSVADSCATLLRTIEDNLNTLTRLRLSPVQSALAGPAVADRGAAVRLGVLQWVDALKPSGVKEPQF